MTRPKSIAPGVRAHLQSLRAAGTDTEPFFKALFAIRKDPKLSDKQRRALGHVVAMEGAVWLLEALCGQDIDRNKALAAAESIYRKGTPRPTPEQPLPALFALLSHDLSPASKASQSASKPSPSQQAPNVRRNAKAAPPTKAKR
jgi:hypothetical protein